MKVHRHCFPTDLIAYVTNVKLMRIIDVLLYISFPVPVTNLGKNSSSIKLKIRGIRAWNSLRWLKFWFISRFRLIIWIFWFILILRNWKFVKVDCHSNLTKLKMLLNLKKISHSKNFLVENSQYDPMGIIQTYFVT